MAPKIFAFALLSIFLSTAAVYADCDTCKAANEKSCSSHYLDSVGAKLVQGATNVGFCWLELGTQPVKASVQAKKGDCPLQVAFKGLANGVGSTCYYVANGAGQVLTCLWPQRVMAPAPCEVCNVEEMKAQGIVS